MKMEAVQEELRRWGELLITTGAGHVIAGDSVESITRHYGHPTEAH